MGNVLSDKGFIWAKNWLADYVNTTVLLKFHWRKVEILIDKKYLPILCTDN